MFPLSTNTPFQAQQDLAEVLWLIAMFSSCFSHFSDTIYTRSHYYTHKRMISHESMAVYELRNTVSALSQHPTIFGFLIRLSSISGQASQNCMALLVLVIYDHPFFFLLAIHQFSCDSLSFFLFVCVKCF